MSFQGKKHEPKVTAKGTVLPLIDLKGKPYLQVAHRLVWFREEQPEAEIKTQILKLEINYAVVKAEIIVDSKVVGSGHKKETEENFADFIEKAETGAIGRALAMAGYGTQFEPELDEGLRLADAPVELPKKAAVESADSEDPKQLKEEIRTRHNTAVSKGRTTAEQTQKYLQINHGVSKLDQVSDSKLKDILDYVKGL